MFKEVKYDKMSHQLESISKQIEIIYIKKNKQTPNRNSGAEKNSN